MKSINDLQAKDFAKWLRKQVREYGRKAEVGSNQTCPVEAWVKDVCGIAIEFICGGDLIVCGEIAYYDQHLFTDWTATSYYMYDEEGQMVIQAGAMLDMIALDDPQAYLIAR